MKFSSYCLITVLALQSILAQATDTNVAEITFSDGSFYRGPLLNGRGQGFGMLKSANWLYVGEFTNGIRTGNGTITWTDGRIYAGEFRDGKCDGNGQFWHPTGKTGFGEFHNDEMNGHITWLYETNGLGFMYVGQVANGLRHGHGLHVWRDGTRYEGNFKDDKREGLGTITYTNGTHTYGLWKNDEFVEKRDE